LETNNARSLVPFEFTVMSTGPLLSLLGDEPHAAMKTRMVTTDATLTMVAVTVGPLPMSANCNAAACAHPPHGTESAAPRMPAHTDKPSTDV